MVMIEDVTTSGKSMEETVPKVKGAAKRRDRWTYGIFKPYGSRKGGENAHWMK